MKEKQLMRPDEKIRTILVTGATSERSSFTGFVAKMIGCVEELAASVLAERRPVMISYNRL